MRILTPSLRGTWRLVPAALLLLLSAFFTAGCQTQTAEDTQTAPKEEMAEAAPQRYSLHGKVLKLDEENKLATIDHDEIVGWMGAMTMDYPVKEQSEWEKLHAGDEINATVVVSDDGYQLGEIQVVSAPAEGETAKD